MFKLWSETNKKAKDELKPDFGLRRWNNLNDQEKILIWKHLNWYFFDEKQISRSDLEFFGEHYDKELKKKRIIFTIGAMVHLYKVQNYAPNYLDDFNLFSACIDFYKIFINKSENVVFELLSLYSKYILNERINNKPCSEENETDEQFVLRTNEWHFELFDNFANQINEVFGEFGINVYLTRLGFIPRQDKKIIEEIYEPVIQALSNPIWKEVNKLLSDAFEDYRKNTQKDYSNCITNTVSAVQAFLQILITKKTGKGDISKLIKEAINKNIIPSDVFSENIFKNLDSIFAKERQEKGTAHPKKEYSNEKNARLILNLAMVFIQHCLQNKG